MRKATLFFLAGFLATTWGCVIYSPDESDDTLSSGSIDWLVDGRLLVTDSKNGQVGWVNGPEDFETFHVYINHEGTPDLGLDLFAGIVVKQMPATFSLGAGTTSADYYVKNYPDFQDYRTYAPSSGSMTITRLDKQHCEGTFRFRGRSSLNGREVNITDGHFSLHR